MIAKMKNIGLRVISSDASAEQADEVDEHPAALLAAGLGRAGEHRVDPGGRDADEGERDEALAGQPVGSQHREHGRGGQREVRRPTPSTPSFQRSQRLSASSDPEPGSCSAGSLPAEQPGCRRPGHDRDRGHYHQRQKLRATCPSQASSIAWTPGGVKSPILTRTSGSSQRGR